MNIEALSHTNHLVYVKEHVKLRLASSSHFKTHGFNAKKHESVH